MPTYVSNYTAIVEGSTWSTNNAPTVLTYSFSTEGQSFSGLPLYYRNLTDSFQPFTSAQEASTRAAFNAWAAVSGLTFVEVGAGDGDLEFGNYDLDGFNRAFGFYPTRSDRSITSSDLEYAGDVVVDLGTMNNMSYWIALHEIGHAIGLKHPHDGNIQLQSAYDNAAYTVMSYNAENATRLGTFDVQAVQALYGRNTFQSAGLGEIEAFSVQEDFLTVTQAWGNDHSEIFGTSLHDIIDAGAGDDSVGGFAGDDNIDGGAGDDSLFGADGHDTLIGSAGDDTVSGGDGDDSLYGGAGNDSLVGGGGADTYIGGAGDDYLNGGFISRDRLEDWVSYADIETSIDVDLDTNEGSAFNVLGLAVGVDIGTDTIRYIPHVMGGSGDDQIEGSLYDNRLNGSFGRDTLEGRQGNDTLDGGGGNDLAFGNEDHDLMLGGGGFDTLHGDEGDDTLDGGLHADSLVGGDGNDSLDGGDGFDNLHGDSGNDTLLAGSSADRAYGGDGDDLIRGGSNFGLTVDGLYGDAGNDTIYGDSGFDQLNGGDGDDLLDGGHQADNLYGEQGNDSMYGGLGLDRLFGGQDDDIGFGGAGNDGMFGELGNDTLYGEADNDRFFGGQGNDMLFGGTGQDTLYGGAGFDSLNGGAGNDLLQGNFNADVFVFESNFGQDTIRDFDATNQFEKIDLSGVQPIFNLSDLFTNHIDQVGADVLIDDGAGSTILMQNVNLDDLDSSDFIF